MPLTEDVPVRRKVSTRAVATEARRRAIIAAAIAAFAEHGYNGTSLRDVAARAELSHTGLLHHFPDKPGLLEAALDSVFAAAEAEFAFTTNDPTDLFRALISSATRDEGDPVTLRFLTLVTAESTAPDHPAHGFMRELRRDVHRSLTSALEEMQRRGRYLAGSVPPSTAAAHLAAFRDGTITAWLIDPENVRLAEQVRDHIALYVSLDPAD